MRGVCESFLGFLDYVVCFVEPRARLDRVGLENGKHHSKRGW